MVPLARNNYPYTDSRVNYVCMCVQGSSKKNKKGGVGETEIYLCWTSTPFHRVHSASEGRPRF